MPNITPPAGRDRIQIAIMRGDEQITVSGSLGLLPQLVAAMAPRPAVPVDSPPATAPSEAQP